MSTIFTPEVTEASVEVKRAATIANVPPAGTRVRLTLGETVIYAKVRGENDGSLAHRTLDIAIEHPDEDDSFLETHIWYESGWTIELLDDEPRRVAFNVGDEVKLTGASWAEFGIDDEVTEIVSVDGDGEASIRVNGLGYVIFADKFDDYSATLVSEESPYVGANDRPLESYQDGEIGEEVVARDTVTA